MVIAMIVVVCLLSTTIDHCYKHYLVFRYTWKPIL